MSFELPDSILQQMSYFLPRETRLKLVDELAAVVGKPIPERISLATGIPKSHVYRYLPQYKSGRFAPSPKTTVRVMRALLRKGRLHTVLQVLDRVEWEMRNTYLKYFYWKKKLRRYDIIHNPLSPTEIAKLKKSNY